MCTLSLLRLRQGYSLMMNRDERRTRALSPGLRRADDGASLFPLDPPSGGTWVGLNRGGAAYALLNQDAGDWSAPPQTESRGRLVPVALGAQQAIAGLERVAALDLSATPPFLLLGVDEGQGPLTLRWDGQALERRLFEGPVFQVSSSTFASAEVLAARRARYEAWAATLDPEDEAGNLAGQEAYHRSQEPPGPLAVCMSRPDAQTLSLTHFLVLPRKAFGRYAGRPALDAGLELEALELERSA
jgi:hypothetical protein